MSKAVKAKASLTDQEIQTGYSRFQSELQSLAEKVSEFESEADEHEVVLTSLEEVSQTEPDRTCFRLIGGILVERTVKDVIPVLETNRDGIRRVLSGLVDQYKAKDEEFTAFKREHGIGPAPAR